MAVIGKIRKRSGLLIIVVGVALLAFLAGDFFRTTRGNRSYNVAVVNGTEISGVEFNRQVEENIEMTKQNTGQKNLSTQEAFNIRQTTWDNMVKEIIMQDEYDELGLTITVDELDDLIRGPQPHSFILSNFSDPQTGLFSRKMLQQFFQSYNQLNPEVRNRYLYLENLVKKDQLENKYEDLVSKAYYVPDAFAEMDYINKNKKASYKIIAKKYKDIADDEVSLTEADYEKYFNEHIYQFTQDPAVDIDYVIFDVVPSPEDRKAAAEEINSLFKEMKTTSSIETFINAVSDIRYDSSWYKEGELPVRIDSLMFNSNPGIIEGPYLENESWHIAKLMDVQMRPDSMQASHILIAYEGARGAQQVFRSKEEAEKLADSLFDSVKRNKSKFTDLAIEFSDDPSVAENQGDLGMFPDGMMIYEFNKAVKNGRVGQIVTAETPFGYHIIHITDKLDPVKKVRVAMLQRKVEPSGETFQDFYMKASAFATENRNTETFEAAVIEEGLNKRSAERVAKMSNNIPGLESPRQIIHWAFNEETETGNVSQVFDFDKSYVVATLLKKYEEGTAKLEDVKEQIEPLVRREKKAEILLDEMNSAYNESKDIYQLADKLSVEVDTISNTTFSSFNIPSYGPERELIGMIFGMEENELSKPFKGSQGVFIVKLDRITKPMDKTDFSSEKRMLVNQMDSRVSREVYLALKENTEIEDSRILFF